MKGDGRGRLQSVLDGKNTAVYFYDARGERTCKIFNGKTTQYIFREGKLIREICGEKTVDYIYGLFVRKSFFRIDCLQTLQRVYEFFRDARYIAYNVPVRIVKRRRTDILNNLI